MDGEKPYVEFQPTKYLWVTHKGLPALSEPEFGEAYLRAEEYLLKQAADLKAKHEWKDSSSVRGTMTGLQFGFVGYQSLHIPSDGRVLTLH